MFFKQHTGVTTQGDCDRVGLFIVVAAGILFVLAIRGLPFVGLFHFDDSPRYALPMILLMLPLGRLADVWHEGEDSGVWASLGFVALLLAGVAIHQQPQGNPGLVYAVAGWSFIWGLGRLADRVFQRSCTSKYRRWHWSLPPVSPWPQQRLPS